MNWLYRLVGVWMVFVGGMAVYDRDRSNPRTIKGWFAIPFQICVAAFGVFCILAGLWMAIVGTQLTRGLGGLGDLDSYRSLLHQD
jgi:hypothetical protein